MEYLRFPAWQTFCMDAVREFDPSQFLVRIDRAETAVLRPKRLKNSTNDEDERLAVEDALKSLRFLKLSYISTCNIVFARG
jgi:hypothetical protein